MVDTSEVLCAAFVIEVMVCRAVFDSDDCSGVVVNGLEFVSDLTGYFWTVNWLAVVLIVC